MDRADSLPRFDNTKLVALNTCPTWGLITYDQHLHFKNSGRAMALEAGQACHDVFASVRLLELLDQVGIEAFRHHGYRLFGTDRMEFAWEEHGKTIDRPEGRMNFCLEMLYTSGFYDDERDKRRTMNNLEYACIEYMDRWPWGKRPVYVEDATDPKSFVGIEIPIDVMITFHTHDDKFSIRFVGKVDGLHKASNEELIVHENKTQSRIDDAWRMSLEMSHQPTGYIAALSAMLRKEIRKCVYWGLAIPQPKTAGVEGIAEIPINRDDHHFMQWLEWVYHTVMIWSLYKDNPAEAPKYTHSCNRYFRPCSMIPFCYSQPDERAYIMSEEMEKREWNPLNEDKAGD